jgi:formate hydrogenlyase subunit 6/NADH:ubiquinone oxidoreductase subunit I
LAGIDPLINSSYLHGGFLMKKWVNKIRSFFFLLPNILLAFIRSPETDDYPNRKPAYALRFRGKVNVHAENCVGCGLCVLDCPANALRLNKQSKEIFQLLHFRANCTYCGQCEQSCRFNAIYLENQLVDSSADKDQFNIILVDRIVEK